MVWLPLHQALLVNATRVRRRLCNYVVCTRCFEEDKSILHCLRDCVKAQGIWDNLGVLADPISTLGASMTG